MFISVQNKSTIDPFDIIKNYKEIKKIFKKIFNISNIVFNVDQDTVSFFLHNDTIAIHYYDINIKLTVKIEKNYKLENIGVKESYLKEFEKIVSNKYYIEKINNKEIDYINFVKFQNNIEENVANAINPIIKYYTDLSTKIKDFNESGNVIKRFKRSPK